jgi:hypothetical protein
VGDPKGFLKIKRQVSGYRPVEERLNDYSEVESRLSDEERRAQAARCRRFYRIPIRFPNLPGGCVRRFARHPVFWGLTTSR